MTPIHLLASQRQHLSGLLEAIQRCVYFLHASDARIPWPLTGAYLEANKKGNDLFEALAAVNERFSKLQDTLGAAMRHSLLLSGEQADSFLKVLAIFEKFEVIKSIDDWQIARTARNLAAHDYETDYSVVAEHFNTLHGLHTICTQRQAALLLIVKLSYQSPLPALTSRLSS
jgi:hypothetical protein